ncbi:helix-turn-helix domain-containing protein [Mammaliicoccus sciuri]|uniref:helix-turn-helix domain-containing protein n=1 Tax=Mammaliicoccus sciuri TaxID=1296 RepID=UPI001E2C2678|nr:helix-turn-helix transcriptional regulator [Mammaliicoccus sciuri]MCD8796408.1 helix-turn-helix domain-containing protein [Mammaliicoccus sciuri]
MNLGKKLYLERKKRNLSKKELSEKLNEISIFSSYSKKKIALLESNQKEFTFYIVDDLAAYFNMTISEFLSKEWKSYNVDEIESINFNIEEYLHGHNAGMPNEVKNLSNVIGKFDLVKSNDWVSLPKYDFIMREYYDYLYKDVSKESNNMVIYKVEKLLDKLDLFSILDHENKFRFPINFERDSAGDTLFNDKREPINMMDLIHNIEWSLIEISQIFEDDYYDYYDENRIGLQLLSEYRQRQNIEIQDISRDIGISVDEYLKWEKNKSNPKIESVIKVCDYLKINIDLLSYKSLRTINNMNSQTVAEFIFYNTEVHNLKDLSEEYFFSERQSMLLIPKYCYYYMFKDLNEKMQNENGIKKAFQFTKEFFIKWYEFNKARQLLFHYLEGMIAKKNFIHYSKEEIKRYLGNSCYPENPVKLLLQLVLDRIQHYGYKDETQIINCVRSISIDSERLFKSTEKLNLHPEIHET